VSDAGRARVFFALWPDSPVRAALADAAERAHAECGGRITAREKIHLTLFFVGGIDRSRIAELETCAQRVTAASFDLDLDVLGYWRHNRIVWAGTRETPAALSALMSGLTRSLELAGYRGEDRPYAPHVTLVRNAKHAPRETALAVPRWRAREFVLVESAGGGTRYDVLAQWPLSARPPRQGF
jgi:2'-5' RNA ligase